MDTDTITIDNDTREKLNELWLPEGWNTISYRGETFVLAESECGPYAHRLADVADYLAGRPLELLAPGGDVQLSIAHWWDNMPSVTDHGLAVEVYTKLGRELYAAFGDEEPIIFALHHVRATA